MIPESFINQESCQWTNNYLTIAENEQPVKNLTIQPNLTSQENTNNANGGGVFSYKFWKLKTYI